MPRPVVRAPDPTGPSPTLVGFLTLVAASFLTGIVTYGIMAIWHSVTPKSGGFLSGLGEAVLAFLSWFALQAFHFFSGLGFSSGILGHEGKVSRGAWIFAGVLGAVALGVCGIPARGNDIDGSRIAFGLIAGAIGVGIHIAALRFSRQTWIAPIREPWMDVK